ncbi:MAG: SDR family NAD(P)-dependent oxidoreductase [Campylobacterales bacterium]|nr:SDR family NAD(P)-dependent oxidoreductase [Campylobacterales bacterium]
MKSLWNDKEASEFKTDLDLRVYTSRLLGKYESLVLHGGGNTSVKSKVKNLFGEEEDILYVKGSGWDLATIEAPGFAPVRMDVLLKMAELEELSDIDMVSGQRSAMTNPSAPNPSVEAILHALIPYKFVDHTHADSVVTITNTENGEERIKEALGDKILVIPYIMPGFVLARLVHRMSKGKNWDDYEGMVLLNHGLFTFADSGKEAYEKMIELVSRAEDYLSKNGAELNIEKQESNVDLMELAKIRKKVSDLKGAATIAKLNDSDLAVSFSNENVEKISQQGPLTPDHVIRTKRTPAILTADFEKDLDSFVKEYKKYFEENKTDETCLNPAPNFAIWKGKGTLSFGKNVKEANIIKDINDHTFEAILKAKKFGGYKALSPKDIFDVEYWSLEQAKLKKGGSAPEFSGKVVVVTEGLSEIGKATIETLSKNGGMIVALDKDSQVEKIYNSSSIVGVACDLSNESDIEKVLEVAIRSFGGIDIIVSSSSSFVSNQKILEFLVVGVEPTVVMISQEANLGDGIRLNSIDLSTSSNPSDVAVMVCAMAGKTFSKTTGAKVTV